MPPWSLAGRIASRFASSGGLPVLPLPCQALVSPLEGPTARQRVPLYHESGRLSIQGKELAPHHDDDIMQYGEATTMTIEAEVGTLLTNQGLTLATAES